MTFLWVLLAALVGILGLRYRSALRGVQPPPGAPKVDDEAIRSIIDSGHLSTREPEPLDMDAAARAEEEFWTEYWDEPEEYRP